MKTFQANGAAIIYNPVARGLSRKLHQLQRTTAALSARGIEATLIATEYPGSATEQARRAIDAGYDLILAAGGDGTLNEVAGGMIGSGVPLGILPGGTANVLAHELRVPIQLDRAAAQITEYVSLPVSVGSLRVNNHRRCFLCMCGAGLDAEIVSRLNLDLKAAVGKLAYYACGFAQVFRTLPEFDVCVDGRNYRASFALISRVRNYGGDLEIARGASLLRHDFEIVLFRGTAAARYLQYLVGLALKRVKQMEGCTVVYGSRVTCSNGAERVYAQVDGELAGELPVTAEILPGALTLMVPRQYIAREQSFVSEAVLA